MCKHSVLNFLKQLDWYPSKETKLTCICGWSLTANISLSVALQDHAVRAPHCTSARTELGKRLKLSLLMFFHHSQRQIKNVPFAIVWALLNFVRSDVENEVKCNSCSKRESFDAVFCLDILLASHEICFLQLGIQNSFITEFKDELLSERTMLSWCSRMSSKMPGELQVTRPIYHNSYRLEPDFEFPNIENYPVQAPIGNANVNITYHDALNRQVNERVFFEKALREIEDHPIRSRSG